MLRIWIMLAMLWPGLGTSDHHNKEKVEHAPPSPMPEDPHYDTAGKHNVEFDHRAISGSRQKGSLSPSDARQQLSEIIDEMDTSNDGFVSRSELAEWVLGSFRLLNEEEAAGQHAIHDSDKDGNLTWPEYLDMVYGFDEEQILDLGMDQNPHVRALGEVIDLDQEKFLTADVNGDAVLDLEEYTAFMHPYDFPHMHHVEIKRVLRKYDKNNDGVIDLPEFMQEEDFPLERNAEQDILDTENFNAFDANRNGKLEPDEIKVWVLPDQQDSADYEANHLIGETDRNGDGHLSKTEILAKQSLWIGSDGADYEGHRHDSGEL